MRLAVGPTACHSQHKPVTLRRSHGRNEYKLARDEWLQSKSKSGFANLLSRKMAVNQTKLTYLIEFM
jgi:hypothetical protein